MDNPKSNSFRIEHFIPDPKEEWVDVTGECTVRITSAGYGRYVQVSHGNQCVLTFGQTSRVNATNPEDYRVTFSCEGDSVQGQFKVEKRND